VLSLSKPQIEFIGKARQGVHLASGAVRSGKTWAQAYAFLGFLISQDSKPNVACLLTAKKRESIERNVFQPIKEILDIETEMRPFFEFRTSPYKVRFLPKNIDCYCEGANDEDAEGKIRGMTIQCWLGDEVSLYPKNVFQQCLTRLSAGARLALLTTNPDSLMHYLYQDYIAPRRISVHHFKITDNPTLNADYIEMLKNNYTGVWYQRFIDGEWGGAEEDMVIPEYHKVRESILQTYDLPDSFVPMTSIDVGWRDFTFCVLGHYDFLSGEVRIDNELVIKKNMTTDLLARRLIDTELDTWGREAKCRWTDIDLRLIEDMNRLHGISMIATRKDNKDAQINALRVLIRSGKIRINPRCEELDKQILGATWDKNRKAQRTYSRTEEHGHFDGVDALLYWVRNVVKGNPYPDPSDQWRRDGLMISPKYRKKSDQQWQTLSPMLTAPGSALSGKTGLSSRSAWK
jgi:PBSX family phage terminase large subunit